MTRPMSEEEREKLMERAREIVADDLSAVTASWTDTQAFARALLSTSSAERGMREALEKIAGGHEYDEAKRDDPWWFSAALQKTAADAIAALSGIEPGEDEQARGQGRSAPISTDTKGTTK